MHTGTHSERKERMFAMATPGVHPQNVTPPYVYKCFKEDNQTNLFIRKLAVEEYGANCSKHTLSNVQNIRCQNVSTFC